MAHVTKRNPDRCPTHPGALLREDVIPATGKTKAEIAQLLGIPGSISMTFCASASRSLRPLRFGSASCLEMAREFGYACRRLTILGTRNAEEGRERNSHAPPESRISMSTTVATPQRRCQA